jgi:hypothetical protein
MATTALSSMRIAILAFALASSIVAGASTMTPSAEAGGPENVAWVSGQGGIRGAVDSPTTFYSPGHIPGVR